MISGEFGSRQPGKPEHVLLYADRRDRDAYVGLWVRQGLLGDDRVIWPTRLEESPEGALASLAGSTPEPQLLRRAVENGQLQLVPAGAFYPQGSVERLAAAAQADGFAGVRMVGDAVTALATVGAERYVELEREFEQLSLHANIAILCVYDPDRVPQVVAENNAALHRDGLRSSMFHLSVTGAGTAVLAGELDAAAAKVVESALDHLMGRLGTPEAVVDLSDLLFCDAAGARALLRGTAAARAGGRTVVMVQPTAEVYRVMSLLGVFDAPGVLLREPLR